VDIYEEILRIYGFDKIPIPRKVDYIPSVIQKNSPERLRKKISNYLADIGFNEIMSNSLTSADFYDKGKVDEAVELMNPLSRDMAIMRMDLLNSALQSVAYNLNRKNTDLKFFEFGKVYKKSAEGTEEKSILQLTVTGRKEPEHWSTKDNQIEMQHLLGIAENILEKLNIPTDKFYELLGLDICEASQLSKHGIKQEVYSLHLDWEACISSVKTGIALEEIPKYPIVRRDLSLITGKKIAFTEIKSMAEQVINKYLREIRVFDIYEGKPLKKDEKSISISLFLYDSNKTMKDETIDKLMEKLIAKYEKELQAKIRR
jgi:phenylalanyl-tRNA synthetase beta chain